MSKIPVILYMRYILTTQKAKEHALNEAARYGLSEKQVEFVLGVRFIVQDIPKRDNGLIWSIMAIILGILMILLGIS